MALVVIYYFLFVIFALIAGLMTYRFIDFFIDAFMNIICWYF